MKRAQKTKLPFVFSNFAMTADGKTAFPNHRFKAFTSKHDEEHMMELRATADAVMSGARTVDLSPATLGPGGAKYQRLRLKRGLREYNLRVIVTGSGSVDINAEIFKRRFSPIIILTTQHASAKCLKQLRPLADDVYICGKREIDFHGAFRWLREKWKVKRLLCEGGGELHGSLIRAGLVNELHLTISPKIFGGRTSPTFADGPNTDSLTEAAPLTLKSEKAVGDERFLVFSIAT